jgi:uncharacterized membrane protein YfcA
MWSDGLFFGVAVAAGAIAAVSGFGIGSLLTRVLALTVGTRVAVAAVSVPHLIGTAFRLWLLGKWPDPRVLWSFGVASAAGGLAGALLQRWAGNPWLSVLFGALLLFTCASELLGWAQRSACASKDGLRGSLASSPVCSAASSEIEEASDLLRCSGSTWTDRSSWRRRPRSA